MSTIDKLSALVEKGNLAQGLKEEKLQEIGARVCHEYTLDRTSRKNWEDQVKEALKFSKQMADPKTFPWAGCSNVIFPLLTTAANTFTSRVYPEVVKGSKVVNIGVCGPDPDGSRALSAMRIANHMNYQCLIQSDTWEPDFDKLLHMLPIIGTCFKKVYFDPISGMPQSDLCSPEDIVIHNTVTSIEKAPRITHRYFLSKNEVIEKMRSGYFLKSDIDEKLAVAQGSERWNTSLDSTQENNFGEDEFFEILEQHRFEDLDEDGYREPYIVVVDKSSETVLGIYPRFEIEEDVKIDSDGSIIHIAPTTYFVDFHFIRSPDAGFYSLGYGHILYPINKAINSLINQLIDAGTLSNTQSGIMSKALNLKQGMLGSKMGEFHVANVGTTAKLEDYIYEFRFKEPSPVLMSLLQLLISAAKEIASINDVLTGNADVSNSKASSVFEIANQGMKVFSSIAKRLHRSLKKEFTLLFDLNKDYLADSMFFNYGGMMNQILREDYSEKNIDIAPVADPNMSSDSDRTMRATAITQFLQVQPILPLLRLPEIAKEFFRAVNISDEEMNKFVLTDQELAQQQQNAKPSPQEIVAQAQAIMFQARAQAMQAESGIKAQDSETKRLEVIKKYEIRQDETTERQIRLAAQAELAFAQAEAVKVSADAKVKQAAASEKMAEAQTVNAEAQMIRAETEEEHAGDIYSQKPKQ